MRQRQCRTVPRESLELLHPHRFLHLRLSKTHIYSCEPRSDENGLNRLLDPPMLMWNTMFPIAKPCGNTLPLNTANLMLASITRSMLRLCSDKAPCTRSNSVPRRLRPDCPRDGWRNNEKQRKVASAKRCRVDAVQLCMMQEAFPAR